jgi:hypothetical protein
MTKMTRVILGTVAPAIFLMLMVAPTAAFAGLETSAIRAEFDSSLTQSQRLAFTDQKETDYEDDNFTGVVVTNEVNIWMVIEGNDAKIASEVQSLMSDSRLTGVTVVDERNPTSRLYAGLNVHGETDPRGEADAEMSADSYRKARIRLRFDDGLSISEKIDVIDAYYGDFAGDGLGGVLVGDGDWKWLEVEIEGPEKFVDYWVMKLQEDESFDADEVLDVAQPADATLPELVSHIKTDIR